MNGFVYYSPTKILFGKDMEWEVGREIAAQGGSRVLLVYGGGDVYKRQTIFSWAAAATSQIWMM